MFNARRLAFGAYADTYDAVRPEWPARTVGWMLGSPATATVCRVVDLGAGTGKGTRAIAALGHQVIAVEPSAGMRERLTKSQGALPDDIAAHICVADGDAENIPVGSGSVDAVAVFQAWHWFESEAAAAECARVLRPGGWLSIGWHRRSEQLSWSRELSDIVERQATQQSEEEIPPGSPEFEPFESRVFAYRTRQSIDNLVLHASTWSYVAIHPDRDRILNEVRALAQRVADGAGSVEIPWTTRCYRLRRR